MENCHKLIPFIGSEPDAYKPHTHTHTHTHMHINTITHTNTHMHTYIPTLRQLHSANNSVIL